MLSYYIRNEYKKQKLIKLRDFHRHSHIFPEFAYIFPITRDYHYCSYLHNKDLKWNTKCSALNAYRINLEEKTVQWDGFKSSMVYMR